MIAHSCLFGFARDQRGLSAVEFALVAPLLFLFYFACVELNLYLSADRKVTHVASALGDLVAQDDLVDDDEMNAIFAAAGAIMHPMDTREMTLRVTSIEMDLDGVQEVAWSFADGVAPFACDAAVELPDGLLSPGQSVIFAEASLVYESPIGQTLIGAHRLEDQFYLRPRLAPDVVFDPPPCS